MAGLCEADDCDTFGRITRGLCQKHYMRLKRGGGPLPPRKYRVSTGECTVDECTEPFLARGLCSSHYARWRKLGDALPEVPLIPHRFKSGEDNLWWGGDDIGYAGWHRRLRQQEHADLCAHCGLVEPTQWAFNWRDVPRDQWKFDHIINSPYTTRFEAYLDLCLSCHRKFDWEMQEMQGRRHPGERTQ